MKLVKRLLLYYPVDPPIVLVSDLHRLDHSSADNHWTPGPDGTSSAKKFDLFMNWCRGVFPGFRLISLGDLYEFWQELQDGDIERAYGILYGEDDIWGNHDWKKTKNEILWLPDIKLFAWHSHQVDILNSKLWIIGKTVTWGYGLLERISPRAALWTLNKWRGWRRRHPGEQLLDWINRRRPAQYMLAGAKDPRYLVPTMKEARRYGAKIALYGHTHQPFLEKRGDMIIGNTGSWTYGRGGAIILYKDTISLYTDR